MGVSFQEGGRRFEGREERDEQPGVTRDCAG